MTSGRKDNEDPNSWKENLFARSRKSQFACKEVRKKTGLGGKSGRGNPPKKPETTGCAREGQRSQARNEEVGREKKKKQKLRGQKKKHTSNAGNVNIKNG